MWHFCCVTGLLESYVRLLSRVAVSIKSNFSLPEDWLARCFFFFCMVHETPCLFGRALLLASPAAVPTHMPSSSRSWGRSCKVQQGRAVSNCMDRLQRGAAAGADLQDPFPPRACPLPPKYLHWGADRRAPSLSFWRWLGNTSPLSLEAAGAVRILGDILLHLLSLSGPTILQQLCPVILWEGKKADYSELSSLHKLSTWDAATAKAFPSSRLWSQRPAMCLERL